MHKNTYTDVFEMSASLTKGQMVLHPGIVHFRATLLRAGLGLDVLEYAALCTCYCGEVSACKVVDIFFASVLSHGSSGFLSQNCRRVLHQL